MSSTNRRVIQDDSDSDDDNHNDRNNQQQQPQESPQPIQADNNNPAFVPSTLHSIATSSPLSSFLVPHEAQEYHLNKGLYEDFIKTVINDPAAPSSTTKPTTTTTTEHEILLIVEALRHSEKKVRIRLFKHNKAHVVFGTWWDYCLTKLRQYNQESSSSSSSKLPSNMEEMTVHHIVMALLKFLRENMADVIKTGGDLEKAKAKWGVDLTGFVEKTNQWLLLRLESSPKACVQLKDEMALVIVHFKEVWGVEIGSSKHHSEHVVMGASNPDSATPPSAISRQVSETVNGAAASNDARDVIRTTTDRKEAAALARLEAMRNQRSRRFGATLGMNSSATGRRDESSVNVNNSTEIYGRKPPPESMAGSRNHRASPSKSYGGSDYGRRSNDAPAAGGSGWGRGPSSATDSNAFAGKSSGDAGWGRTSSSHAASGSAASSSDNGGWGRTSSTTAPQHDNKMVPSSNISEGWGKAPSAASTGNNGQARASGASVSGDGWGRASSSVPAETSGNSRASSSGHSGDGWGRSAPSSNVAAAGATSSSTTNSASGSNDGWGKKQPSSNVAAANKSTPVAASNSLGNDGWGRSTPSSNVAAATSSSTKNSDSGSNDGWGRTGPSSNVASATKSNQGAASSSHGGDGWGRSTPSSNVAAATSSSATTSVSGNTDGWGRTQSSPNPAAETSSTARISETGNNDEWSRPKDREIPPYSSSYTSSSNGAYGSLANRQPHPLKSQDDQPNSTRLEPFNSSDHNPSSRGGDIRDNQPLGSTGSRNNDSLHRQSHSYASNRDDNETYQSRQSSYDRKDSRASYQSRSSDRIHEDRRDYEDRRRSDRSSSFRSDSPPSSSENRLDTRRYDDNHSRDGEDRYDSRPRRDRDDSCRGSNSRKRCSYFFSEKGCRSGSKCRFSHDDNDRKPSADRPHERGGYERKSEEDDRYDRGIEDGEVRPAKRFRGDDNGNPKANVGNTMSAPPPVVGAGRGRGRGANINLPAWMTNSSLSTSVGPTGVSASSNNQTTTAPSLSNADLKDALCSIQGSNPSVVPAGRGSGRGNVDNRPAWMTRGTNGQSGPVGAPVNTTTSVVADRMSGRFAPPSSGQKTEMTALAIPPGMGRGRGRGTDNRPAWMTRGQT
ncbi:hypothetical protein HJC23_001664 [Cyclotella cryptica]|uniref:C3H1-type domain-containing protein n=1 Tax=Cyclotella cryptica TaxID=29204 RepID=A0ABD3QL34_9STRA